MSQSKVLSWLIGVVALGFFYAGEALAVCCKSSTGCSCTTSLTCPLGKTKVSSCTTSGGGLTLNGSRISCISNSQTVGTISADRDSTESGVGAVWTEIGLGVTCEKTDDFGFNSEGSGPFDLAVEYKMTSAATCNNATGVLTFEASCGPNVAVKGTLKPAAGTTPPPWVAEMCTDSKGQLQSCPTPLLVLGGFQSNNKGIPDPKKCLTDFPNQSSAGGLPAGKVLLYKEFYAPGTNCTGPRVNASDGQRRMCQDHTFFNPNYNEATGTGATNPPCAPQGNDSFRAGILATDEADIIAAPLFDNQWTPGPTLNLSCNNAGNVPTTITNSENFAASAFQLSPPGSTIVAYVKGKPNDVSPATAATVISGTTGATGLRVTFDDCTGANGNGLDQVICRGIDFASNPETVDLTIRGERSDGLGFIGDAIGININNAATKCPGILQGQ